MIVCELCLQFTQTGECKLGLKLPKGMSCREFLPCIQKFCADPKDFVNSNQVIQMAAYFGMKGRELQKVKQMGSREESLRLNKDVQTVV